MHAYKQRYANVEDGSDLYIFFTRSPESKHCQAFRQNIHAKCLTKGAGLLRDGDGCALRETLS